MSRASGPKGVRARPIASYQLSLAEVPARGGNAGDHCLIMVSLFWQRPWSVSINPGCNSLSGVMRRLFEAALVGVACRKGVDSYRRVALQQP